ncbi:unnamed protein product [Withania somnifera]
MLLLIILLLQPFMFLTSSSDLTSVREALLSFRSAVGGPSALSGTLPMNTFSNLTRLRTLSLRLNRLFGPLTSDLSQCLQLRNVYLQGNFFSGSIAASLSGLHFLVRLNLADNNFSGEIPSVFNNLTRLRTLLLDKNQFSGSLPELKFPSLKQFNVSFNKLNGLSPRSLEVMPASDFIGDSLCGKPLNVCSGNKTQPAIASAGVEIGNNSNNKRKKLSVGATFGIVIGSFVGFLVLMSILFVLGRMQNGDKMRSLDVETVKKPEIHVVEEKHVEKSENGGENNGYLVAAEAALSSGDENWLENGAKKKLVFFGGYYREFDLEDLLRASAEVLGKGTFGTAYKAVLETGTIVAIKRLKDVAISERECKEKIEAVGEMNHDNLVPLRAYYFTREEKLLVTDPRKVSQKADVYSFGVLLLELLTGKAPNHALLNEEGVDLPRWVQSVVREEWPSEVFDIELLRYQTAEEEMVQLLQLAIDCTTQYPDTRPSMAEISKQIEEIQCSISNDKREHSDLANAIE